MKSLKILLPVVLTFALLISTDTINAQSSTKSVDNRIVQMVSELIPTKAVGLNYAQSLIEINAALTKGVKSDHSIDFQGKLMVAVTLDANGLVQTVAFDKNISQKLAEAISSTLKAASITPVSLNGKAKAQAFNIPLIIK